MREFLVVSVAGFLGAFFDSFLGSLLQAKYRCRVCGSLTEKEEHHGEPTELVSGISSVDNDVVNLLSCAFSSLLSIVLILIIYA